MLPFNMRNSQLISSDLHHREHSRRAFGLGRSSVVAGGFPSGRTRRPPLRSASENAQGCGACRGRRPRPRAGRFLSCRTRQPPRGCFPGHWLSALEPVTKPCVRGQRPCCRQCPRTAATLWGWGHGFSHSSAAPENGLQVWGPRCPCLTWPVAGMLQLRHWAHVALSSSMKIKREFKTQALCPLLHV